MAYYRCYALGPTGKILHAESFDALTDAEACVRARELCARNKWLKSEVWQGGRWIKCPLS